MREEIEPGVLFGPQLDAEGLRALPDRNVCVVIDLRRADENGNLLPPHEEAAFVQRLGLGYHHVPIDWRNLEAPAVDRFRSYLHRRPGGVYVHSRHRGERAALLLLIDKAVQEGWSGSFAARTAEELGILRAGTRADRFVAHYVSIRT